MDSVVNTSLVAGVRVLKVLVDETLDVELPQDDSLPGSVEAEPAFIFMNLAFWIFFLGRVYRFDGGRE